MSRTSTAKRKWRDWHCGFHGCWKIEAVAETKAKRNLPPKPKVENTPPSPDRVRRGRPSPRTAIEVWERDKGLCHHCGDKLTSSTVTFDHVIPVCRGGRTYTRNLVLSCHGCNRRRGNKPMARKGKPIECETIEDTPAGPREIVASVRAGSQPARPRAGGQANDDGGERERSRSRHRSSLRGASPADAKRNQAV